MKHSLRLGIVIAVTLIIFFNWPFHVYSQNIHKQAPIDTATINHLINVAENLQDPDSALLLYNKLLEQSQEIGYLDGAYNTLMQMAILYREKDDYQKAQILLKEALDLAPKVKRKDALAWCYNNLGDLAESQGDYKNGASYFYKALNEIRKVPSPNITAANININLGYLYKLMHQPQKAMEFYTVAERICMAGHYNYQLAGVYINKGAYFIDTHQPDSSRKYFIQVSDIANKLNLTDLVAMANSGIGASLVALGEYKNALPYLQKAIDLSQKNYHEIARDASYILGDALLKLHRYKDAEAVLVSALEETKSVNTRYNYIESYAKLIEVYKATGQYRKAMDYMDSVAVLNDSLMSIENAKNINLLEVKYNTAEKDKELAQNQLLIAKQKSKLAQKNTLIALSTFVIILVSLLLLLRYRSSQNKKRIQTEQIKALQHENTISILRGMVQGEENERERLARDLHDGIGGMLSAAIMRFMTMRHTNETVVEIPAYKDGMAMLDEIGYEVREIAHNLIPAALQMQSLPEAIFSYCNSVQESSKLQINFLFYGEFDQLTQNFKLNVYRIIQELLKNIVAHANASSALVQLAINDNILSITVEDNGVGFDKSKHTKGIGLRNLQTRVSLLQGSYTIESGPFKGTSVFIEFDLTLLPKATPYENKDSYS